MDQERLARMYEASLLRRQTRLSEARALFQQASNGGNRLQDMQGLLSRLTPGLTKKPSSVARSRPVSVDPGMFLDFSYANDAGERAYKLYVPTGYVGRLSPLIVMLHGGTQGADDFAAGTRMNESAERQGFLVAYPEQSRRANPNGYWNWFQPKDQRRGGGEPSLIAGITAKIMGAYAIDPRRVYVGGFSAGGAMAAVMAGSYPDVYAAAGVHSGLAAGVAHDIPSAFAAMAQGSSTTIERSRVPLIVFHGDADSTVRYVNADGLVRAVLPNPGDRERPLTKRARVQGGHEYTRRLYAERAGSPRVENWTIHEAGHAWSGGSPDGTYTDPQGPDASAELVRFFSENFRR
jgi:poly(hydroxyalkanoate) depolymerase family esterase